MGMLYSSGFNAGISHRRGKDGARRHRNIRAVGHLQRRDPQHDPQAAASTAAPAGAPQYPIRGAKSVLHVRVPGCAPPLLQQCPDVGILAMVLNPSIHIFTQKRTFH